MKSLPLLAALVATSLLGAGVARADLDDLHDLPPPGRPAAASASLAAPCHIGACVGVGGELWWKTFRLAVRVPLRASFRLADSETDRVALGSVSVELGARFVVGRARPGWLALELGASAPTGTDEAHELDVERFALAPWAFGSGRAALWLDGALGYANRGQFALVRLGLLQELDEIPVTADAQLGRPTRVRLGLEGGAELAYAWRFAAGGSATAAIAPRVDWLLFHDDENNLLGGAAYEIHLGVKRRFDPGELAFALRVPFWQRRAHEPLDDDLPRAEPALDLWFLVEATGRFWF